MHKFDYNCYSFFPKEAHIYPQRSNQELELINEQLSQMAEMTENSDLEKDQKQ